MIRPVVLSLLLLFALLINAFASAEVPETNADRRSLQIGPQWNRTVLDQFEFAKLSPALRKVALSTASFNQGTAVYLGKIGGKHVMATNTHVMLEKNQACFRKLAIFSLQGRSFECEKLHSYLSDVELALFTLKTQPMDDVFFNSIGVPLELVANTPVNTPLAVFGHGSYSNPTGQMVFSIGSNCRTFSPSGQPIYMNDVDSSDPLPYKVWSFAVGCNSSWGDSGSAVVDARTGRALGLLWTSKFPKSKVMRDVHYLNQLLKTQDPIIWKQMTYSSSFLKLRAVATQRLKKIDSNSYEAILLRSLTR